MENKQTALEWYEKEISSLIEKYQAKEISQRDFIVMKNNLFHPAKAMEKEQIIDAYEYGYWRGNNEDECEPEQYYENPYCDPNNKKYENNN